MDGQPTEGSAPLVSCIMPTADRRPFVPLAIACFLRQDYPRRELVVLDDGADPVADLMPDDERVRYARIPAGLSLGEKRNRACALAAGALIAHWDDDDWHAPGRLSYQVALLAARGAPLCGAPRLFFYSPAAGQAWLYAYPNPLRPWLAGGTLCYTRALWSASPFPAVQIGEDTRFAWAPRARVCNR